MEKTIQHLTELGLSEKEARIYIALVEIGKGTAYAIAKQSGLKRPTVYMLLDELRKKDLILKVPHAKNQIFIAKDPEELFAMFEDKLYRAKKALPELLSKNFNQGTITTHLFDGTFEIKQALEYRRNDLENKEMLAFYGVPKKGRKIPEMYYEHARALKQQNTNIRVLASDDESLSEFREKDQEYGQNSLYLSKDQYSPTVSVEVSPNLSKIYLHGVSQALVIEGKEFSKFLKQIFEIIWKSETKKHKSSGG